MNISKKIKDIAKNAYCFSNLTTKDFKELNYIADEVNKKLIELESLKARIDGGVRVNAYKINKDNKFSIEAKAYGCDNLNATLILDDGVKL